MSPPDRIAPALPSRLVKARLRKIQRDPPAAVLELPPYGTVLLQAHPTEGLVLRFDRALENRDADLPAPLWVLVAEIATRLVQKPYDPIDQSLIDGDLEKIRKLAAELVAEQRAAGNRWH